MSEASISLKCSCGATADFLDGGGRYINPGGAHDSKGRKYRIEVHADDWLDRHESCRETACKPQVMAQVGRK